MPRNDSNGSEDEDLLVAQVRTGHGANCSSLGSAVDALFLGSAFGAALYAAASSLADEINRGEKKTKPPEPPEPKPELLKKKQ